MEESRAWAPCYVKDHELAPEDPAKLQGPEIGQLVRYIYDRGSAHRWNNIVVKIIERSYVWAPEIHMQDGFHGVRHYDWSVIQYGPKKGQRMVVDDKNLYVIGLGEYLTYHPEEEMRNA